MRQYSTTAKYKGFTELLMTIAPMTTYPNEKVERTVKMLGVQSDNKEDSKNRANNLTATMRRDLKLTNEAIAKGKTPSKCQRYSVCKEYLTVEEVSKRIKENKENLENPRRTYIENMAGWYFWIQLTPSQEEYFSMQYQQDILNEKQSPQLPEERNEEIDYG